MKLIKVALLALFILSSFSVLAKPFTDRDLDEYLRTHKDGIIYIWNPLMPLSVQGLEEARLVAREMKIGFIDIVD